MTKCFLAFDKGSVVVKHADHLSKSPFIVPRTTSHKYNGFGELTDFKGRFP